MMKSKVSERYFKKRSPAKIEAINRSSRQARGYCLGSFNHEI